MFHFTCHCNCVSVCTTSRFWYFNWVRVFRDCNIKASFFTSWPVENRRFFFFACLSGKRQHETRATWEGCFALSYARLKKRGKITPVLKIILKPIHKYNRFISDKGRFSCLNRWHLTSNSSSACKDHKAISALLRARHRMTTCFGKQINF